MINALIGKLQGDGSVAFIYCHERGDMPNLGQVLLQDYNTPDNVDTLLQQGHCKFPGNLDTAKWNVMGQIYCAGNKEEAENKQEFLARGEEEVQALYLYNKDRWQYVNMLSTTPRLTSVRANPGEALNRNKSKRPFYTRVW